MSMMDVLVHKLAQARFALNACRADKDAFQLAMNIDIEARYGDERRRLDELLETAASEALAADEALRAAALAEFEATGEKQVHPAVQVKVYTTLEYDEAQALDYCREHLHKALRLDKRTFETVARAVEPTFVTFVVEPKATVATKLDAYVSDRDVH